MIKKLISESLLRKVRSEIQENLSFTPKETDIYRIHQSGDLANLDGLDNSALERLPSLLRLRDALYSEEFRTYLTQITKAGVLSGKKTDMAVNVYTPGCHLLCHDDVIGSRRVSYILYLTDPDNPWKEEWGGALRLYPTKTYSEKDKRPIKLPSPDSTVSIPPSFGQLSFFAVQPGESFHDVEEVYAHEKGSDADSKGDETRVRMAISGWYHIPQEGEDGYSPGLEEKLADKSSLQQLQGKADEYDLPQPAVCLYDDSSDEQRDQETNAESSRKEVNEDPSLTEDDLEYLLKYLAPTYLTPDTLNSVSETFTDQCSLCLDNVLSNKFAGQLREFITAEESQPLPTATAEIEDKTVWKVARPPHKHRFLFQQPSKAQAGEPSSESPLYGLLNDLSSKPFRKWLQLATGQTIRSHNLLARRFRRGKDYTLATSYDEDSPRLEVSLSITPTPGWGDDETTEAQDASGHEPVEDDSPAVGGYLAYMAGDEDGDNEQAGSDHGIEVPTDMSTGGRASAAMKAKRPKADPAVYKAAADDEDDGVLFSMPASWNRMGLVLRDRGTMKFVKYVSQQAKGDRWDIVGDFEVEDEDDEEDEEDEKDEEDEGTEARQDESHGAGGAESGERPGPSVGNGSESVTEHEDDDNDDESDDSDE